MSVKHNIKTTDLLIIDEVSMVSAKTFNKVEVLCRKIRDDTKYFGGIQVILSGDFYQLPPVPNKIIGDSGNHCFKLPWFNDCFPHKVQLNIIHRQSETALIQCINALEKGELSNENVAFLNSLDRPLPNEDTAVHLYARNYDVDIFNYNKIQQLQGELKTYKANDVGSDFYLRKFLAPKNLGLKVGCRVMLVRNLSDTLVNGLCGTVNQLNSDSVDVKFIISNKLSTVTLKPVVFTTYDPADKVFLAKRTQIPLKLAYAITVHKAQGMSLKRVVVNCEYCFQPGQIGVAVGRAEQVDGLRVRNFKKSMCRKHPSHVLDFYNNFTLGILKDDLSCCRHVIGNKGEKKDDSDSDDEDDNDDDDDSNDNTCTYAKIDDNFNSDSDFSDSEIEKLELLDCFIEKNVLTKDQSSSQAKAAIDSVFNE
ncbi:PIF1 [Mytilus coruscus]|uniref:ATP-dependent DNA helicase n=1 Tax=Mytilus coruscus TaxID=42192 RepID=A0A6J8BUM0_MYTCO|nr:PIF1 [Mytilus coruscus]